MTKKRFDEPLIESLGFQKEFIEDDIFKKKKGYEYYHRTLRVHNGCNLTWFPDSRIIHLQHWNTSTGDLYHTKEIDSSRELNLWVQLSEIYRQHFAVLPAEQVKELFSQL